jgi:carboxymethylenebutenolidase
MADLEVATAQGTIRAHLALPPGSDKVPGVVVLHEAYGLTDDIRAHADHLAASGYLALAPDLYSRGGALRCVAATMAALARGRGRAFDDIEAARAWLAGHERCTGRMGVIGFCQGGGFAIALAASGRFDAAAPNYGLVPRQAERELASACPIVGSYGGDDWMMRGHAGRLEAALEKAGIPHDVKVYPGASHSFLSHHSGRFQTAMDRILRTPFAPEAAEDAWARILAFFASYLAPAHDG